VCDVMARVDGNQKPGITGQARVAGEMDAARSEISSAARQR
jgi:hypothetical protein